MTLGADPVDPDLVYVGGVSIYRSRDAGGSWTRINNTGADDYVHVDQHEFVVPAADTIWSANDGGINLSTDQGDTWDYIGLSLNTAQYYHFTTDPVDEHLCDRRNPGPGHASFQRFQPVDAHPRR